jgi:hypothetical protein
MTIERQKFEPFFNERSTRVIVFDSEDVGWIYLLPSVEEELFKKRSISGRFSQRLAYAFCPLTRKHIGSFRSLAIARNR